MNFSIASKISKDCNHEWKRGHTTCIDPDGWYYDQPTHEVEYVCSKCGKIEWRKI